MARHVLATLLVLGVAASVLAQEATRVALLPFENISGDVRSLQIVMPLLQRAFAERGYELVPPERLEPFLFRHQIRPTSMLSLRHVESMRQELGVRLAIVGSVGLYNDAPENPQWGLSARALSTENGAILWAQSAGVTGEEFRTILGLGTITSGERLAEKAVAALLRDVPRAGAAFAVPAPAWPGTLQRVPIPSSVLGFVIPFGFKAGYRSPTLVSQAPKRVAVLPFENRSQRRGAARIVTDVFVTLLFQRGRFEVIEPGVVSDALLAMTATPFGTVDLETMTGLRARIAADAVIVGTVHNYSEGIKRGASTSPELEMDARMLDTESGRILWSAAHGRSGDDYELLLDFGKARSAVSLAAKVMREMLETL
jgi:TolB-like protein